MVKVAAAPQYPTLCGRSTRAGLDASPERRTGSAAGHRNPDRCKPSSVGDLWRRPTVAGWSASAGTNPACGSFGIPTPVAATGMPGVLDYREGEVCVALVGSPSRAEMQTWALDPCAVDARNRWGKPAMQP